LELCAAPSPRNLPYSIEPTLCSQEWRIITTTTSIEENILSDEEDSVPNVLYEEESDSNSESEEEEETFIPGVEDDQSIGSKDPAPDGDPIP